MAQKVAVAANPKMTVTIVPPNGVSFARMIQVSHFASFVLVEFALENMIRQKYCYVTSAMKNIIATA